MIPTKGKKVLKGRKEASHISSKGMSKNMSSDSPTRIKKEGKPKKSYGGGTTKY